jgi:hypothetical protein
MVLPGLPAFFHRLTTPFNGVAVEFLDDHRAQTPLSPLISGATFSTFARVALPSRTSRATSAANVRRRRYSAKVEVG